MKLGIVVPQFVASPEPALTVAQLADQGALDGVFVFDHLWDYKAPGPGPVQAAMPLLSALAALTRNVAVGTLVARVGLIDNELLFRQLAQIHEIAGDRFVAGLGIGDKYSIPENEAYGVPLRPRPQRLELMQQLTERLMSEEIEVWLGGRSIGVREVAIATGARVNQWQSDPAELLPTDTWGGRFRDASEIKKLQRTDIEWAAFVVPGSATEPKAAVDMLAAAGSD